MSNPLPPALVLLLFVAACGRSAPGHPPLELDFVEIEDHSGWFLRIHGDGSGSLGHEQLPAHHLHYPLGTFNPRPARRLAEKCAGQGQTPVCTTLRYYVALEDATIACPCTPGTWSAEMMQRALQNMQLAVDAGASERSCRMLRRQWLALR
ncbi:hypothetical protein QWY85_05050 [Neolewinella lacunae]|uniref:Uncharacterized protein n=1 Tax=Neolewinella lacunae TaxID=1517758 RepID=A0A923PLB8_9BACT|nr:hypothetical protein [Neolewinella lacunae]MBC6996165.1 hypothetical protein [Neolewinella lacunae]MDN3634016.1 hypothetical protein [Neolewinella lacunae]